MSRRRGALLGVAAILLVAFLSSLPQKPEREPAGGKYAAPEDLVDDYERAMEVVTSTETIANALSRYFACVSFRDDSESVCGRLDRHLNADQTATCGEYRISGLMLWESVRGNGAVEHCVRAGNMDRESPEGPLDDAASAAACRSEHVYLFSGDLDGYCAQQLRQPKAAHEGGGVSDMRSCRTRYAFLSGDPDRCTDEGEERSEALCRERADLLRALRENGPARIEASVYAPLADPAASCEELGERALEGYETFAAQYAANRRIASQGR